MAITRRQSALATGDPAVASWGLAPLEGSLLVAELVNRSDLTGSPTPTIGSGYSLPIQRIVLPADAIFRRALAVGWKKAGASEGNVTGDWNNAASTNLLRITEFAADAGEGFSLLESVSNDNSNTADATSISSGTTPSTSGDQLLIGTLMTKDLTTFSAFTGLADVEQSNGGTMSVGDAWAESLATGTKETTASLTGTNNGLIASLLVFDLAAAVAGTGSHIDQIVDELVTAGHMVGSDSVTDGERKRLLSDLVLAEPQGSMMDLYELAGEDPRIWGY